MRDEETNLMWLVCINMEFVRASQSTGKQMIVSAAVPLAADPADRGQKPKLGKFRQDQVFRTLAVELQ